VLSNQTVVFSSTPNSGCVQKKRKKEALIKKLV
jgi:hypothetical protein